MPPNETSSQGQPSWTAGLVFFAPLLEHAREVSAVIAPQPEACGRALAPATPTRPAPPRLLYAVAMLGVAAASTAAAFVAARAALGADASTLQPALLTAGLIASVSLLGLLPALVTTAERFGLAVLGASMARLLLAMFAAVVLTEVGGVENRPVWFGVIAGAGLGLIAETTLAVAVLAAMERRRTAIATERHGSESRATILPEPSTPC